MGAAMGLGWAASSQLRAHWTSTRVSSWTSAPATKASSVGRLPLAARPNTWSSVNWSLPRMDCAAFPNSFSCSDLSCRKSLRSWTLPSLFITLPSIAPKRPKANLTPKALKTLAKSAFLPPPEIDHPVAAMISSAMGLQALLIGGSEQEVVHKEGPR
eukprot:3446090-Amphidinium_carterae.2